MPDKVTLIDPQGAPVDVSESVAPDLLAEGYRVEGERERVSRSLESEQEEAFGSDPVAAASLGVARAATFGLSDVALRSLGVTPEFLRETRHRNRAASLAGELGFDVAAAIASGGASLAGKSAAKFAGGKILSKTPTAALARAAEKAGQGRIASSVTSFAAEGALHGAGQYVSRLALSRDPEFSGEALASHLGLGAVFGGVAGAAGTAAGRLRKIADTSGPSGPEKLLRHLESMPPGALREVFTEAGESASTIGYRKLIPASERTAEKVGGHAAEVVAQIDQVAGIMASARKEVKGLFAADSALAGDAGAAIRAQVGAAMIQLQDSATKARRWRKKWAKGVKFDDLVGGKLPPLADESAEEAIATLARLDSSAEALGAVMERARATHASSLADQTQGIIDAARREIPARPSPADDAIAQLQSASDAARNLPRAGTSTSAALDDLVRSRGALDDAMNMARTVPSKGSLGGVTGRLQDAAGALAIAQDAGLPLPELSAVPGIGPVLDAYLKFRVARNALRGVGQVPRSSQTRAGEVVSTALDRAISAVASPAIRRTARIAATKSAKQVVRLVADLDNSSQAEIASTVSGELGQVPDRIVQTTTEALSRQISYLQDVAPRPPGGSDRFSGEWLPSHLQAAQFSAQYDAVADPLGSTANLLSGLWTQYATLTASAIKATNPALWETVRGELLARQGKIVETWPYKRREYVGRIFDSPLVGRQLPQYAGIADQLKPERPPPSEGIGSPGPGPTEAAMNRTPLERRLLRR